MHLTGNLPLTNTVNGYPHTQCTEEQVWDGPGLLWVLQSQAAATVKVILLLHTTWTRVTPFRFLPAHLSLHSWELLSYWFSLVVCCGLDQWVLTWPSPISTTQAFKMERLLSGSGSTLTLKSLMSRLARMWSNMPGIPYFLPLFGKVKLNTPIIYMPGYM